MKQEKEPPVILKKKKKLICFVKIRSKIKLIEKRKNQT